MLTCSDKFDIGKSSERIANSVRETRSRGGFPSKGDYPLKRVLFTLHHDLQEKKEPKLQKATIVHVSSLHAPIYRNFYLCIGKKNLQTLRCRSTRESLCANGSVPCTAAYSANPMKHRPCLLCTDVQWWHHAEGGGQLPPPPMIFFVCLLVSSYHMRKKEGGSPQKGDYPPQEGSFHFASRFTGEKKNQNCKKRQLFMCPLSMHQFIEISICALEKKKSSNTSMSIDP